ncbi:hypothetical protein EVAR_101023_1 [Eumeta japonica]|uniref:Uncharacterized protein n=1 Tax=Eumeta variegata TaxID=151549 RepID=A0A4C1SF72_EUMVA|nr:hypothetical protein EVAR_101023_1 [Eumeta japonica]
MQLHPHTIFCNSRIRPSKTDQLKGSNLDQLNRSGPDLKICPRSEAVPSQQFVRRSPTTFSFGRRCGTEDLFAACPDVFRRGYDPDGSVVMAPLGVQFMEFSRFSQRSRGGVSGFTVIFQDRHGRLWV